MLMKHILSSEITVYDVTKKDIKVISILALIITYKTRIYRCTLYIPMLLCNVFISRFKPSHTIDLN